MSSSKMNRRSFLRTSSSTAGAILAAPYFVPATVLGLGGAVAPSEKITVGFIGTGSHGTDWNMRYYLKQPDAIILAVCDVDSNHMDASQAEGGRGLWQHGLRHDQGLSRYPGS